MNDKTMIFIALVCFFIYLLGDIYSSQEADIQLISEVVQVAGTNKTTKKIVEDFLKKNPNPSYTEIWDLKDTIEQMQSRKIIKDTIGIDIVENSHR